MTDNFPTARSTLKADRAILFVWCTACYHQGPADLQGIVDAG
jgi:hypothetical protein